ncbi:MAG: GNAT family N-acetyltransferase [Bacteroidetes bacterium]|nr:MAG: GNAT family N-acetyltransferase [Bacteroidota bacterium]TAE62008.1 MAG: GNAT family N-acetyltransferase [Bacteroidota bacterium]TAF93862.1 MAG: GNAT family N-acetyltransferase [Bacteroidota bacterium]
MLVQWECFSFDDLPNHTLYQVLRLRSEVFVVEQNCVFLDADNADEHCLHLCGFVEGNVAAYARLVPPGILFPETSIGRVVTSPQYRGSGLGKVLMEEAIELCHQVFGEGAIQIGAQLYLQKFYESFGFTTIGEVYVEDGIDHIHMMLG